MTTKKDRYVAHAVRNILDVLPEDRELAARALERALEAIGRPRQSTKIPFLSRQKLLALAAGLVLAFLGRAILGSTMAEAHTAHPYGCAMTCPWHEAPLPVSLTDLV